MIKINLNAIRAKKKAQIDQWRIAAEQAGMSYEFPGGELDIVQLRDERDRTNITALVTNALILQGQGVTDPVLVFRAQSNTSYQMTPAQIIAMGAAVGVFGSQMYQTGWGLKEQVDAATTAEQIEAITWPQSSTN